MMRGKDNKRRADLREKGRREEDYLGAFKEMLNSLTLP